MNQNIIMLAGKSATGKSMALRNIKDPQGVIYLNCENNKSLPFPAKFQQYTVTDPYQVHSAFEAAETKSDVHTIVIDSLTYLMEMFESIYIVGATNTMNGWSAYAEFFKVLMQKHVASSTKNIIFTAHTLDVLNESEMVMETLIKVKGSLMNNGIESRFNTVVSNKKVPLSKLKGSSSKMLNITEEEELLGFKYVFQTRLTKETVNERIRASLGMWDVAETFIDNDIQHVLDRLHTYYGTP